MYTMVKLYLLLNAFVEKGQDILLPKCSLSNGEAIFFIQAGYLGHTQAAKCQAQKSFIQILLYISNSFQSQINIGYIIKFVSAHQSSFITKVVWSSIDNIYAEPYFNIQTWHRTYSDSNGHFVLMNQISEISSPQNQSI